MTFTPDEELTREVREATGDGSLVAGLEAEPIELARVLVVPGIGEVVRLDNAPAVARALAAVKTLLGQAATAKRDLEDALAWHSTRAGTKTLRYGTVEAVVKSNNETEWDIERLRDELRAAGLPEERLGELIRETVEYKVNAAVARQVAGANPEYARIIEGCKTVLEKRPSVTVTAAA